MADKLMTTQLLMTARIMTTQLLVTAQLLMTPRIMYVATMAGWSWHSREVTNIKTPQQGLRRALASSQGSLIFVPPARAPRPEDPRAVSRCPCPTRARLLSYCHQSVQGSRASRTATSPPRVFNGYPSKPLVPDPSTTCSMDEHKEFPREPVGTLRGANQITNCPKPQYDKTNLCRLPARAWGRPSCLAEPLRPESLQRDSAIRWVGRATSIWPRWRMHLVVMKSVRLAFTAKHRPRPACRRRPHCLWLCRWLWARVLGRKTLRGNAGSTRTVDCPNWMTHPRLPLNGR